MDVEARGPHQMASSVTLHAMFHNRVPHQSRPHQSARQLARNPGSPSVSLPQFWDDRCIWSLLTFAWHQMLNSGPHTCIACTFPTESPSTPDRMLLSQHCSVDALDPLHFPQCLCPCMAQLGQEIPDHEEQLKNIVTTGP